MPLDEFNIITTFFTKPVLRNDVVVGIGDDCAVLTPPPGKNLLVSTDTLNVGSHFFPDALPYDIGYKAVSVSLSDVAAMGGEPAWLLLSLTLPEVNSAWLTAFSQGLFACLEAFGVALVGGNMARGPLAIATQILGFGDSHGLTRQGAQPGDLIFVTGWVGDAGLALAILKQQIDHENFSLEERERIMCRLHRPTPRVQVGQMISGLAHAAIDLSDGLLADLGHILNSSQVGATIYLDSIPTSPYLERISAEQQVAFALAGGDDYELCFTLAPENVSQLPQIMTQVGCKFTPIGKIEQQLGLRVKRADGTELSVTNQGYTHF